MKALIDGAVYASESGLYMAVDGRLRAIASPEYQGEPVRLRALPFPEEAQAVNQSGEFGCRY